MKAIVLGASGFAGRYLCRDLADHGYEVFGLSRNTALKCDLLNAEDITSAIRQIHPDVIFHMVAQSSVGRSWREPQMTFAINVDGTLNLLEAVHQMDWPIRVLMVGSSEQYGNTGEYPIDETVVPEPTSPYAVSKCTQEMLGQVYFKTYGVDIVMTRSFNHIGIGQPKGFVIPDLIAGVIAVEEGRKDVLLTGNLSAKRDFTDVRDIVRAYRLLSEKGVSGEVYNVGSGNVLGINEVLDKLIVKATCPIRVAQDPVRMRPSDNKVSVCSYKKLKQCTGWEPKTEIDNTLQEMLDFERKNGKM